MTSVGPVRIPPSTISPVVRSMALVVVGLVALAVSGQATTVTWSATPTNGNWSVGGNWAGGTAPNPGDDLVFPATSTIHGTNNDLVPGTAIHSIAFDGNGYTLAGNAITLAGGEAPFTIGCTTANAPGSNTISLPIIATGNLLARPEVAGCSLILSGAISGTGVVRGIGPGPTILSGADTYTGATMTGGVDGFLIINGTLAGTSGVTATSALGISRLEGSGTFTANLTVRSDFTSVTVVAPGQGSNTGILSTGAALFDGVNTTLSVKLNGTTVGTEYDQLNVTGGVSLVGVPTLDVALGFVPPNATAFTIVKNNTGSTISGTFAGLPEGATFVENTTTFQISYVGGAGHDIVLTVAPTAATPATLAVDSGNNGVLETGELAVLQPSWTNTSGASLHLTGATANFTGPAGPTYANPDASGDYGTIADGDTAQCTDCYSLQITAASRPVQHWDATIDETVSPGSITKTWLLHVGESFPDVPTSQQFYKFIENLFHNGVTGGCGGGGYCPDNPVTRAQMAVFLLKGEHGSTYLPPACSSTVFADVPCPGGQFVDWINQLASENITGGCGGGNYCPGSSVNRGQMAVFLLKGEHGGGYAPPACAATVFTDVPCPGAQFVNFINQLAAENITGGCGGGNYCPGNPVNRGQMAVFLVKTFGLVMYGP